MSNSLVIAGQIELLGQGLAGPGSTNPACPGAVFLLQPGYDLSAPQPTADFVASLLLDGERPQGYRASNRTITLPIIISAPTFAVLAGARELLQSAVDQQSWTLTWTRDQGTDPAPLPLVFDCFRALPTTVAWGGVDQENISPVGMMSVQFSALPYGRADMQDQIAFAAPVPASPPPPPAPVVLDAFATISSPQCAQSTQCIVGPNTCFWDPGGAPAFDPDGAQTPLTYSAAFTSPLNLTGMTSLQMYLGLASRTIWHLRDDQGHTRVTLAFTLTDTNGVTLSFSRSNRRLPVAETPQVPKFTPVTVAIPQTSTTFTYSSVASWSLTITNRPTCLQHVVAYLDALTAYPYSQTVTPVTRGNIYTLYGVKGAVHAPASLSFQAPPVAGTPTTVTATGAGSYTVPAGTVYLKVECIGGGGAGAGETASGVGGGGGGGEYAAENLFAASPGQVIPYSVGIGGAQGATPTPGSPTAFGPAPGGTVTVLANGGQSAAQNSITGGAGGTGSTDTVHFPGGAGRSATGSVGGGGGSSGGSASAGLTPTGTASVVFTTPGTFTGGFTAPAGITSVFVECWGSGASAATGGPTTNGGGGGGGEYAAGNVPVTPGNSYTYVVGAGGASVTGTAQNGNNGANSTFTGDSGVVITAHGGTHGSSSGSAGGGNGGSGSSNTTHFNGGKGGPASPYSGSGGSSAGTAAAGNTGSGYGTATAAPSGGGGGGAGTGANSGTNGTAGTVPGGGGGGCYGTTTSGAGAGGQVRITYPGSGTPTNTGASAVTGGGAGGNGGPSANTVGSAGSQPGGGGGGADSTGTAEAGGAGGAGQIKITPFTSPPFSTLIVHRPKRDSATSFQPLVGVGNGSDVPDGTHYYTMPQPVAGVNATFGGTYTVVLANSSWNSPSNSRTITVTVTQVEYNYLTGQNAGFEGGIGNWAAVTNCSVAASALQAHTGTGSLGITSTASGDMIAASTAAANYATQMLPCIPGQLVAAGGWFRAAASARSCAAGVTFYTSGGAAVGSVLYGTSVTDSTTGWTSAQALVTVPATAAFCRLTPKVISTGAASEVHFFDDGWIGTAYQASTVPSVVSPGVASLTGPGNQVNNGIFVAGVLTLPVKALAGDNTAAFYQVSVTDTNTSDRFYDCLLLDTQGQTLIINEPTSGYINYYADEPNPVADLGHILGSQAGRAAAVSVVDAVQAVSGGPFVVTPGDCLLFAYSADGGAPSIGVSYYPRYFFERTA